VCVLGNDKILQPLGGEGSTSGKTTITNDGATILKSLWIDNPAAKILVGKTNEFFQFVKFENRNIVNVIFD
jgi:hypothetical protein